MKKTLSILGMICTLVASALAHATTYSYSYTFDDSLGTPGVITGTFDGTASGNLITGLSGISASLNGVAFNGSGSLYGQHWTGSEYVSGGAIASFDGTENNFIFIDSDFPDVVGWTNYFYSLPLSGTATDAGYAYNGNDGTLASANYNAGHWTVAVQGNEIPEPESLALMTLALLGMGLARRKGKQA